MVYHVNCIFGDINWVHFVHAAYELETKSISRHLKQKLTRPLFLSTERKALSMAKVVIAHSNSTRHVLIETLGIPANRVNTVYDGIDSTRFRPPNERVRQELRKRLGWDASPRILFVGALGERAKVSIALPMLGACCVVMMHGMQNWWCWARDLRWIIGRAACGSVDAGILLSFLAFAPTYLS